MAITKLMKIGESKGSGNPHDHLKNSIRYICQDEKTEGGRYISGNAGTTPEAIYQSMVLNKEYWNKTRERQGYHYILSFPPSEQITPELCSQIADEFARKLLGENYLYVTAVHTDKDHLHAHLVFDSVSCVDGLKFHSPTGDWEQRIQPITDELCRKYHLETLQYEKDGERKGKHYGEWKHDKPIAKTGEPYTAYDIVRDDIDEAISHSDDYEGFLEKLLEMKYQINRNQKILSVKPHWRKNAIRTGRLGRGYSKEEICLRISNRNYMPDLIKHAVHYGELREINQLLFVKVTRNRRWKLSAFQRQYYRRLYRIYHIRKPIFHDESWKYKEDILRVKKISKCFMTMLAHDIETSEDLQRVTQEMQKKIITAERSVSALQTKLYRSDLFRYLKQFESAEKQYQSEPGAENWKKMQEMKNRIEKICPIEEALNRRQAIKDEIIQNRLAIKDIRKELKALTDGGELNSDMSDRSLDKSKAKNKTKGASEWNSRM